MITVCKCLNVVLDTIKSWAALSFSHTASAFCFNFCLKKKENNDKV